VRFPLGLGQASAGAATPPVGSVLVDAFRGLRALLTVLLIGVVAVAAIALLLRWPPLTMGGAAMRAAAIASVAIAAAPAARAGYVVYPVNLAVWGWLVAGSARAAVNRRAGSSGLKPST